MDSISQFALGSAVGVAVMGKRTAVWKAALWGGIVGTLPDLDALIDFGDAISNMIRHRAESHGLFVLTLFAPLLALLPSRLHGEPALFKRWWLALWLALFTHPILDWFTIYGTQLLQPFSDRALGLGSMFIVDPLYTLPLLFGLIAALVSKRVGLRANALALAFSCAYLAWSAIAQQHVTSLARTQLQKQNVPADALLFATPAPFNTFLWRVVYLHEDQTHEGFYSFLDKERVIQFDAFPRGQALARELADNADVKRMTRFTDGFVKLQTRGDKAVLCDLRMGQEPAYVFCFELAQRNGGAWKAIKSVNVGNRGANEGAFNWLWRRMWGEPIKPPR
jgi:inner membrane protein